MDKNYNTQGCVRRKNLPGMVRRQAITEGQGRYRRKYRYTKGRFYRGRGIYDGKGSFFGNIWKGIKTLASPITAPFQLASRILGGPKDIDKIPRFYAQNIIYDKVLPLVKQKWLPIAQFAAKQVYTDDKDVANIDAIASAEPYIEGLGGLGRYRKKRYTKGRFYRGRGVYDGNGSFWGDRWNEVKEATNWAANKVVDNAGAIANFGLDYITKRGQEQQEWKNHSQSQNRTIQRLDNDRKRLWQYDPDMQPD